MNQKTYSILIAIVAVVIIGASIFLIRTALMQEETTTNTQTSKVPMTYRIPDDYVLHTDRERGFKIAYPNIYGALKEAPVSEQFIGATRLLETENIRADIPAMSDEPLRIVQYADGTYIFDDQSLWPSIKLTSGKWTVVAESQFNIGPQVKVGEEFLGDGKPLEPETNEYIDVYWFDTDDQGLFNPRSILVFQAKGNIYVVHPPFFKIRYEGYRKEASSNDMYGEYKNMVRHIMNSIRPLDTTE